MIIVPKRFEGLTPLGTVATVKELTGMFRLPVSSFTSPLCIRKNTDPERLRAERALVFGHDMQGFTDDDRVARGIIQELLCKHLSCFGKSGSGKSTFILKLLMQLSEQGISCLVIESAKKEYRVLKNFKKSKDRALRGLAKAIEIYTPGAESVSPLRFNPMRYPKGIGLFEHIENIKSCIEGSIPVSCGSLPALLFEALEEVYERFAGSDSSPVIADVVLEVENVLARKGYSSQTRSDMRTVIEVRLGSLARSILGQIFQCSEGIDIEKLMQRPAIMELDVLPTDGICVSTLFLLNAVREHARVLAPRSEGLRYVIIIEEAHNILGSSGSKVVSEEMADPKSAAADFIEKMLLELRELGIGVVLCDQHPSNIHVAASKSVASELTFRQTHGDDRDELEKSMLFGPIEAQDIARLRPGEAYFFTEGYYGPRKIRTENLHARFNLKDRPSDSRLHSLIENEAWFKEARSRRIETELLQFSDALVNYEKGRKIAYRRFKHLLGVYLSQLDGQGAASRQRRLRAVFFQLRRLRAELLSRYREFIRGPWRRFRYLQNDLSGQRPDVVALGSKAFEQWLELCRPLTRALVERMDKYLKEISTLYSKELQHG